MFLDPDPKRSAQRNSGSGFFSSQRPIASPRNHSAAWRRKSQPLNERSQSENNQLNPGTDVQRPTVRLVKPSPEPAAGSRSNDDAHDAHGKENRDDAESLESSPTAVIETGIKPGSSGSADSGSAFHVSGSNPPTNEAQSLPRPGYDNVVSTISGYAVPTAEWHRRSGSSGSFSNSSTLKGSESAYGQKSLRSESRISQATSATLRSIPTPYEYEHREHTEAHGVSRFSSVSTHTLQTLDETSPERSTVRLIATPAKSSSSERQSPSETPTRSIARPRTSPSDSEREAGFSQRTSRRTSSAGSLPTLQNIEIFAASPTPRHQTSQESIARSESTNPLSSSPNVVAFYSDSSRPRSQSHPLHPATSVESIQSRLQQSAYTRPATSSSWASRPPSSDAMPPLYVPRKRLRHKAASSSLNEAAAAAESEPEPEPEPEPEMEDTMEGEDYDILPFPRQAFSTHLSTIASESDGQSRVTSQQFSLGSGVMTVDDSSGRAFSGSWPLRERDGMMVSPVELEGSPVVLPAGRDDEPGDMTMQVYREESAMPQPLFHVRSGTTQIPNSRYNAPLPPVPQITRTREGEEDDLVSELIPRQLREQRSGYSLRRRSQSTPSWHSRSRRSSQASESSRWSNTTFIFPTWAKHYYSGGATLLSSSQISLSTPVISQLTQTVQLYGLYPDGTNLSITSRLGTDYADEESLSPTGSRFLPSIFRSRTRGAERSWYSRKRRSRPSPRIDEGRPDSMVISPLPPLRDEDVLSSGQPKYGNLRDDSDPPRPLPRAYSKQRRWDDMEFPRPMSKDQLAEYDNGPHLAHSKRTGNRLSAWRAPSFVESLDTLVRSRCNRQILLFALGFIFPPLWMVASILPLPKKPLSETEYEDATAAEHGEDDVEAAMTKHEAGDAEQRWLEEKQWLKARWWRYLNRIMSVIGVLVIAAVIALAVVATTK